MTTATSEPVYSLPNVIWEQIEVKSGLASYSGRLRADALSIDGAKVPLTFVWSDSTSTFVRCGAAVPELLSVITAERWESSLAAAVIVAAMIGHPRRRAPGVDIEFVWSDHVALGAGLPLSEAMRVSRVRTTQPAWLHGEAERLRVTIR